MSYLKASQTYLQRKFKRCILFLIYLLVCTVPLFASLSFTYHTFCEIDGLSHGKVTQIIQDRQGCIWLSTWNGLNMYDGYKFHTFKANPGDNNPLVSNRIDQIYLTTTDNLWCVTQNNDHVYFFNRKNNYFEDLFQLHQIKLQLKKIYTFRCGNTWMVNSDNQIFNVNDTTFQINAIDIPIDKEDIIHRIISDSQHKKWIVTTKGVFVYSQDEPIIKRLTDKSFSNVIGWGTDVYFTDENSLYFYDSKMDTLEHVELTAKLANRIDLLTRSARNELIIAGTDQFILYNTSTKTDTLFQLPQKGFTLNRLRKDKHDNYWAMSEQGAILRIAADTNMPSYFFEIDRQPEISAQLVEDKNGVIWVVNNSGELYYYLDNEKRFIQHSPYSLVEDTNNPIRRIFVDNQNNIWTMFLRGFGIVTPQFMPSEIELAGHNIRYIKEDKKGNLWIASKEGYLAIKNKDGEISYVDQKGSFTKNKIPFGANVYCIYFDGDNNAWLGTKEKGIFIVKSGDFKNRIISITHSDDDPYSLSDNSIYSICEDSNGGVWIGTYGKGINKAVYETLDDIKFMNYNNVLTNYPIANRKVRNMQMLSPSVMGVATTDGLVTFSVDDSLDKATFFVNTRKPSIVNSLSDNNLINLFSDGDNQYAVTYNGGLNKITSNNLLCDAIQFDLFGMNIGAASEIGLSTVQQNDSIVWICYESALSSLNLRTKQFVNFRSDDFGAGTLFSEGRMIYKDNILYIPSNKGLILLNINQLRIDTYESPILINSISIKNKNYKGNPDRLDSIFLSKDERTLTISFAAINYKLGTKAEYAIMLEGMTQEWDYIGTSNSVNFSNLAPGEYLLKIKSTNSNGVWSDHIRTIYINVKPKFSETIWAKVIYVILAFLLFYFGRILFFKIKKMMIDYKKALEEARQKRISASLIPNLPEIESTDKLFLEKLLSIVEDNISNSEFTVDDLSSHMAMGKTNFYKKIKELLGQTPVDFIREIRIKRAMQLLSIGQMNVTEVAYASGFSDPKFFSKTFKKMLGVSPKDYKNAVCKPSEEEKDTIYE